MKIYIDIYTIRYVNLTYMSTSSFLHGTLLFYSFSIFDGKYFCLFSFSLGGGCCLCCPRLNTFVICGITEKQYLHCDPIIRLHSNESDVKFFSSSSSSLYHNRLYVLVQYWIFFIC